MLSQLTNTIVPSFIFLATIIFTTTLTGCPTVDGGDENGDTTGGGASSTVLAMENDAHVDINTERTTRSLAALTMREDLRLVARGHSEDMAARDYFAHDSPEGDDAFDRMAAAGITYQTAGENIAWNNFPDPVDTAVTGWMNSDGHRANILDGAYTHTGMGVAGDGNGGYYFTQVFTGGEKGNTVFAKKYMPPPLAINVNGE